MIRRPSWIALIALILGPLAGMYVAQNPVLAAAVIGAVGVLAFGAAIPGVLSRLFILALGIVLTGYAFFGRAFAYIGIPPIFIGELLLGLGLASALVDKRLAAAFRSRISWLLLGFALWGAARTMPYLSTHGMDALRDGVLWGYGAFALIVAVHLAGRTWVESVIRRYARLMLLMLLWIPPGLMVSRILGDVLPLGPNGVPLELVKAGDAGVHLGGIAAFLLLGFHHRRVARPDARFSGMDWVLWIAWLLAFAFVAAVNRGGMLSALLALGTVVMLRPRETGWKVGLACMAAIVLAVGVFVSDLSLNLGHSRNVSVQQIADNFGSVTQEAGQHELDGTREWRLSWWTHIVDYTFYGPYFWTGKGYGINLADDDGFQLHHQSLRSPHNGHLTVLARSGVPGFALWVLLQATFSASLLVGYWRARRVGQDTWGRLHLWILAYWVACLVDTSFDVYLEGPQGGIWFWTIVGVGITMLSADMPGRFRSRRQGRSGPALMAPDSPTSGSATAAAGVS